MKKGLCVWMVTHSNGRANYCGAFAGWKMVKDDDQNRVRKYYPFCEKHDREAKKQDELEEEL